MALIDVKCQNDHISEVYRAAADWPNTPACPDCGQPTEQIHRPRQVTWTPDPVVVFKASDGSFRFPGDPNGLSAKQYKQQGMQQIEIRGAAEMRSFEKQMNKREYSRLARNVERKQEAREQRESELRSQLRDQMQRMSPLGRAVARAAMQRNDGKPRPHASHPGFLSEVYSYDRSNRDASRDAQGRRRRD